MKKQNALQQLSDAELLAMVAKEKSSPALKVLMERHEPILKYIAHRFLRRQVLVEDLLQDVWLIVLTWLEKGGYAENEHFPQWLHTIAYRRAKAIYEKETFLRCDEEAMLYAEENLPATQKEKLEIEALLSVLPQWQKCVIQKRVVEEKTVEETAEELNMEPGAVRTACSKALSTWRKLGMI